MKKVQIKFDEVTHTYTDEYGNKYTSATTLIGKVTKKYNAQYWAMYRVLDRNGYKLRPYFEQNAIGVKFDEFSPIGIYTIPELYNMLDNGTLNVGKTPNEVRKEWKDIADEACMWGNKKHNYLEDCINRFYNHETNRKAIVPENDKTYRYKIIDEAQLHNSPMKESHIQVFQLLLSLVQQGYILYAEKRVYSYEYKISGTIDVLAVREKEFYIVDWKTNKDDMKFQSGYYKKVWNTTRTKKIKTNEWITTNEKFLYPLQTLNVSKGMIYTLQLSLYAYICEMWGLVCNGLILCHIRNKIKEDGSREEITPKIYSNIAYKKNDIKTLFDWHLNCNIKGNKRVIKRVGIK